MRFFIAVFPYDKFHFDLIKLQQICWYLSVWDICQFWECVVAREGVLKCFPLNVRRKIKNAYKYTTLV